MRPETQLNFLFLTPDLLPPPPPIVLANLSDNCIREFLTTHSRNLGHCPWGLKRHTISSSPFMAWQLGSGSLLRKLSKGHLSTLSSSFVHQ